ncbi:hypothetical protein HELRODRAFT_172933 [Helobdella robusta]|uniref:Uncharacterized protein n=1 Tax=Helobdella robusta TaxID=6412 RepID=T1F657_HELRO|nr:hypothetical protein HELRODRAFT_172933 [Helobdella robusta]ESO03905.1 hypothetical protein HELRODRAFT_172933 [Helobdella robusta]
MPNIPLVNSTVQLGKPLWSDISRTPTEDSSVTLVTRKNKRPRALNSDTDNNNIKADTNSNKRSAPKIIGKNEVDCKLKADKVLYNKRVYSMSNIQKCSASDVSEFLSSCGINVLSCYPVFKNTEPSKVPHTNRDNQDSSMFRVCIDKIDSPKINDPNIIPKRMASNKKGGSVGIFIKQGISYSVNCEAVLDDEVIDFLSVDIAVNMHNCNLQTA